MSVVRDLIKDYSQGICNTVNGKRMAITTMSRIRVTLEEVLDCILDLLTTY
jgi:hypothetical protein